MIDNFDGDDNQTDYAVEVTADIEMAIAMAPGLDNVYVYEGPTPQDVPPVATNDVQSATTTAQINDVAIPTARTRTRPPTTWPGS